MFSQKKIKFKKILSKDLKKIFIWRNDSFIRSKMLNQKKISYKDHLSWYKNLQTNKTLEILKFLPLLHFISQDQCFFSHLNVQFF